MRRHVLIEQVAGIAAEENRVEEPPVEVPVDPPCSGRVLGAWGRRHDRGQIERDPDLGGGTGRVGDDAGCQAVAQQEVVRGEHARTQVAQPWGVLPLGMAYERRYPRLVECDPTRHPVTECRGHDSCVVLESLRGVSVRPSSSILQGLG